MVLGGLWHGAAWTFVLWGLYHGLLLIAYRAAERVAAVPPAARGRTSWRASSRWAVMFHVTCFGWLMPWCDVEYPVSKGQTEGIPVGADLQQLVRDGDR